MTTISDHDGATTVDAERRAAPRTGAWALVLHGGRREVVELPAGVPIAIGRSRSSGIVVRDDEVSRLHATLEWDGAASVRLLDHGSRNGVWVEGARLREARLASGAALTIGPARVLVFVPPSGGSVPDEVAVDPAMLDAVALADRAAATRLPVLLLGETGVGKEVLARRIHERSARAGGPFVAAHCGAIVESLAESTLFGHERGAFTGADEARAGLFEQASGGTLFLDEVGELGPAMQARLLRVLEDEAVTRVGGTERLAVDARVVAATHRDLDAMVERGAFRRDLLYRLDVLRVRVPPLRERPDDVGWLAARFAAAEGRRLSPGALARLRDHAWPGNVRELRNAILRAAATTAGVELGAEDLDLGGDEGGAGLDDRVADAERDAIEAALSACDGNQTRAAARLGVSRRALIYRMEKHGLKTPPRSRGGDAG